MRELPDLPVLVEAERSCLARYVDILVDALGDGLVEVVLFGSVARGESWPRGMPIRSDVDLLVVTEHELAEDTAQRLIGATYPLFLESGRQIGPQFRTRRDLKRPNGFLDNVRRDGVRLYG